MIRLTAIFLVQYLLWFIAGMLNHSLAAWQIYIYTGGLFVTYAALYAGPREGLIAVILNGFLFDAASPVPFGQHALLQAAAFTILHHMRARLAYGELLVQTAAVLIVNLVLFAAKCALQSGRMLPLSLVAERLFWDAFFSSLVLALLVPWTFALQDKVLAIVTPGGFNRPEED